MFFSLFLATALAGQESPIQWPVPPPGPPREAAAPPRILIGAPELVPLLAAGAVPVDVRGAGPFTAGHLPGAVPAWSAGEEGGADLGGLRERLAGLGISGREMAVVYGDPQRGNTDREVVARFYRLLRQAGCAEVRVLDGGLAAWRAAGRELAAGQARRAPVATFRPASNREEVETDAGWIAGTFAQAGVQLLDVRDARGWERWETPPIFAAGHIPYSLPFDPRTLLPPGSGWPDPAAVRRHFASFGPRPGDPVRLDSTFVLYGEDGRDPRLDLGYLLLNLAGLDARVFPGGWKEWTADGGRPVVRVIPAADLAARLRRENPGLAADRPPRGLILFDLREPRDFAIGHLPGALSLPFLHFPEDFGKAVAAGWPGADRATIPLVLYCYGIDCVRSRKAGAQAASLGFHDVLWFRGGIEEWRQAGYPLLDSALPTPSPPPSPRERVSPGHGDGCP
jgi:thiosulfate/3-mercaptopyruvate sulfurtransferase